MPAKLSLVTPERTVDLRPRTILRVLLIVLAVGVTLEVIWIARHVLAWVVIALFLALALDPLVRWIQRRTRLGRGSAIGLTYLILLVAIVAVGATFVPKLVDEVNGFVQALPNYVHDLTHGRGRLGFLERKYHVVEKVREQVKKGGATKVLGLSGAALSITKSVITIIAATVTIVFLTFFMLLEGGAWMDRVYSLFPAESRPRWRRVGHDIYRTVGGYVTGNILIPLAGATVAGVIVCLVAFLHSVPAGIVVLVFFVVYQQLENHFLQPVIYGRTVQLSPLAVLISVLVGAELAGILGALAAIPVAGALQVIVRDQMAVRRGPPPIVAPTVDPAP